MRVLLLPALTLAMAFAAFTDARASGAYASAAAADAAADGELRRKPAEWV